MAWKNIPPDQKPNYGNLNEGQKRYAWEQYKLALVRRGLPFDHPIPDVVQQQPQEAEEPGQEDIDAAIADVEEAANQPLDEEQQHAVDEFEMPAPGRVASQGQAGTSAALPEGSGTARGQGKKRKAEAGHESLPGTAEGQASAPMEGGPRERALPNPTLGLHPQTRFYRKVHRFLTFGIAYDVIQKGTDAYSYFMTTPLAKIPWDRPYLYINPAEFAQLPDGAHCERVRINVISRNVRIAFPTNSTASNLAKLNQNKDLIIFQGINKQVHMLYEFYNDFHKDQPMIPAGFDFETEQQHQDLVKDMYGPTDITKDQTVPRHQMGIPTPLPWYGIIPYSNPFNTNPGFPCLQHYYKDVDADSVVGNEITSIEYKPSVGLLTQPIQSLYQGYPSITDQQVVDIPRASMRLRSQVTSIGYTTAAAPSAAKISDADYQEIGNQFQCSITTPLEKSQWVRTGNFMGPNVQAQDSFHIGLQPVVALTTASLQGQSNSSFTDSQAYFEVIAEMEVNCSWPTPWPLYTAKPLVTEHSSTFHTDPPNYYNKTMYSGLYVE
nr:MAG: VP2 [Parvoviridae sp.]